MTVRLIGDMQLFIVSPLRVEFVDMPRKEPLMGRIQPVGNLT